VDADGVPIHRDGTVAASVADSFKDISRYVQEVRP